MVKKFRYFLSSAFRQMWAHWVSVVGTCEKLRDATGVFDQQQVSYDKHALLQLHQEIFTHLSAASTVSDAAMQIRDCAKKVFDAGHVIIYVTHGNADCVLTLECGTSEIGTMPGEDGYEINVQEMGHKAGLLGHAVSHGKVVLTEDLEAHNHDGPMYNPNVEAHGIKAKSSLVSTLDSPLSNTAARRLVLGAIVLMNKKSSILQNFGPADATLMEGFRVAASACLHGAMVSEQLKVMAQNVRRFQMFLNDTQNLDPLNPEKCNMQELVGVLNAELVVMWETAIYQDGEDGEEELRDQMEEAAVFNQKGLEAKAGEDAAENTPPSWDEMETLIKKRAEPKPIQRRGSVSAADMLRMRTEKKIPKNGEFQRVNHAHCHVGARIGLNDNVLVKRMKFGKQWSVENAYISGTITHITDIEIDSNYSMQLDIDLPPREHGVNSLLLCPIIDSEGACYGVIQCIGKKDNFGYFEEHDMNYLQIVCSELAGLYNRREAKRVEIETRAKLETLVKCSQGDEVWRNAMEGDT